MTKSDRSNLWNVSEIRDAGDTVCLLLLLLLLFLRLRHAVTGISSLTPFLISHTGETRSSFFGSSRFIWEWYRCAVTTFRPTDTSISSGARSKTVENR